MVLKGQKLGAQRSACLVQVIRYTHKLAQLVHVAHDGLRMARMGAFGRWRRRQQQQQQAHMRATTEQQRTQLA